MNTATWPIRLAAIALALAGPATAAEPSWRDFKDVSNTSFVEPSGDRSIQLSVEVPAPAHDAFQAFATSQGFASWAVPVAEVDFRIGGHIEASYDPHARIGDPANIRNEILAYVPDRLIVIHNVQAPPGFADPELFGKTVTVIEFLALDPARTRVTITNAGYGAGERFAKLYRHFEWGDAYTLQELRHRFERGPVDWAARFARERAAAAAKTVEDRR
ncbi:MAG: SRPBCC domain-containing protein [Proteobacteria bacterium]|nr:SRPBCC domain-containing protein [Pseudomonadota bacterium]